MRCHCPRRELFLKCSSIFFHDLLILINLELAEHVHIALTFEAVGVTYMIPYFISQVIIGHARLSRVCCVYLSRLTINGNLSLRGILGHLMDVEIRSCLGVYREVYDVVRMEIWHLHGWSSFAGSGHLYLLGHNQNLMRSWFSVAILLIGSDFIILSLLIVLVCVHA